MKKVLIIGATGTIGNAVRETLLRETDDQLTLFARQTGRLTASDRETVVAGNVMQDADLDRAIQGQDAVFVALSGNLGQFAQKIVAAMDRQQVSRLLFITSMGIYDEIPASVGRSGNLSHNPVLQTYRNAADVVEGSDLNYTVIRPGLFTNGPVNYEVTRKGEPFGGHDVSIASIADMVWQLTEDANLYSHDSIGLNMK